MGIRGVGVMRILLVAGAVFISADFIDGLYNDGHPFWYGRTESSYYRGRTRSARSRHMYKRQANLLMENATNYLHCTVWSNKNFRTFDGLVHTFDNNCEFDLATLDDIVAIRFITNRNCTETQRGTLIGTVMIEFIYEEEKTIYLLNEREGGGAVQAGQRLDLPYHDDSRFDIIAMNGYIQVKLEEYGWRILYDPSNDFVSINVMEENSVEEARGLCGKCDEDDMQAFGCKFDQTTKHLYSWGTIESPSEDPVCDDTVSASQRQKCDYLNDTSIFGPCHGLDGLNLQDYIEACYGDVCATEASARDGAECNSIAAYVQECSRHLGAATEINWRTDSICPLTCHNGSEYMSCPSICDDNSCNATLHCEEDEAFGCLEGCRCPPDQFLRDGVCTSKDECPCEHRGKTIPNGDTITDDCNICECTSGSLQCTEEICPATCTVTGYAHHSTFDNKQFNFQGNCEYTMLKDCWNEGTDNTKYEIRAENGNCEKGGYSCIKAVKIEYRSMIIRMALDRSVTIDGKDTTLFPYFNYDIYIDVATKDTMIVHLGNGVSVRWDRNSTMAIEVTPEHYNRTCGLCGTFNKNQKDDFYTAAGDTETNSQSFGNKWKFGPCRDVPVTPPPNSCSTNRKLRPSAEEKCEILNNAPFTDCHSLISPSPYIEKCKTDVCSCSTKNYCHCAMIAEYASECYRKGVKNIDWREASSECAIDDCAKDGLNYTQCLPSCQSSCAAKSFSSEYTCHDVCIEGCVCPPGKVRGLSGTCIEPEKCHCTFEGELFASGETRMERCGVCTCENGGWQCDLDKNCTNATCGENEEYVVCLTLCPKTCDNANNHQGCDVAHDNCTSGCQCQPDKVLHNGQCIPIELCPCEHCGLTYQIGDRVKETDCTEIICSENGWISQPLDFCPGKCSAYGNTHVKTFDYKAYDFQGDCEYIFAETVPGADAEPFNIIIKNIPCGLHGVTCTKSIEFIIGDHDDTETIFLVRGKPTPSTNYPISGFRVIDTGTNVVVLTKIGVTLVWHKNTFLEVQLDPIFRNKVQGLCGNYDDNADNDFQTRSGGQTSDDSLQFSYEWRAHNYCPYPSKTEDACDLNPHRRAWSYRRCNELKSERFELCRKKIDVEPFYEKCVSDSCGCDMGGDCDCLCTAIAAYAYECTKYDVPVNWRRQDICPIQCEECESYDPCINPCQYDCSFLDFSNGGVCNFTCVEGCRCPPGQYYNDGLCVEECRGGTMPPIPTTTPETKTEETTSPTTSPTTWPTKAPSTLPATTTTLPITSSRPTPSELCECYGYGDPHYFDFAGIHLDDQGVGVYILSRDLSQVPPLYRVLIDNIPCVGFPTTSCPRELIVEAMGHKIRLLSNLTRTWRPQAVIDGKLVAPPYLHEDFALYANGIFMVLVVPDIGLEVRFLPLGYNFFRVVVPLAVYYNNTDGLCGWCGLNKTNCQERGDCCEQYLDPPDPGTCENKTQPAPCVPTEEQLKWCDNLFLPVFAPCWEYVDPYNFFDSCKVDICVSNRSQSCWSLEAYAQECSYHGICLEWRNETFCHYPCPPGREFKQCVCPEYIYLNSTCVEEDWDEGAKDKCELDPVEGCFCPPGTKEEDGSCVPCCKLSKTFSPGMLQF